MSPTTVSHGATDALIAAAALVAQDHLSRNPHPVPSGDNGERHVPLITMDMVITCQDGVRWTIAVYAPRKNGSGMVEIAIITNHDGPRLLPPHVAALDLGYVQRLPIAAEELRWIVESSRQEGQVAA